MTVAEALAEPAEPSGGGSGPQGGGSPNGGRVARLRRKIRAYEGSRGQTGPSLPPGIFSRPADDPDETDNIRTVDGYVSLPYAAEYFGVHRQRLQEAVWRGALPGVKTDSSRTAPWMVKMREVAFYLGSHNVQTDRPRGGRPAGARNLSEGERRFAAATLEIWRRRHAPWLTPEETAQLGERLEAEAS